ncbi:MAG: DUF72 domain-containing protein [Flavisolibacter sp.]|jgi:uncharacterized protein YecE (DUF72 family)
MDFGRLTPTQLKKVDLGLPPEPALNSLQLKGKRSASQKVYTGCAKWGIKEWVGKLYPEGTKEAMFLKEYVNHYNCLELNATHYKIYPASSVKKWADQTRGHDFKYSPKVYKGISHFGNLSTKQHFTDDFLKALADGLEEQLGPVFMQVSDRFTPKRKTELFEYLATLPKDLTFFLEVRHPDWYIDPHRDELFKKLQQLGIGSVITDAVGRRDCCHMHLTIPKTIIRFVGNSLHPTDYLRIDDWVNRIHLWLEKGIKEIYFFMHMHEETYSPELSQYLTQQLNKVCGLNLKVPVIIKKKRKG